MFLAVNNTIDIGTLKCELILHLCTGRKPTSFFSGSAYTASSLVIALEDVVPINNGVQTT